MNFKSDNTCSVSKEILDMIVNINNAHQNQNPYGFDQYSKKMQEKFSEIFEIETKVFLTSTGTAANCLGLSSLIKPYQSIFCSKNAHIQTNECGAPFLFTGGSMLNLIKEENGKIDPADLLEKIESLKNLKTLAQKQGCISITQATECGTVYSINEIETIAEIAKKYELPMHMDGARFANSLVKIKCKPSDLTWKTGIDAMTFGATKNGALNAEAIVFFNQKYSENFEYAHKRAGQTMSKNWFFSAQFLAYFENDLWLENACKANLMAKKLELVFKKFNIQIQYPVDINEVFVLLNEDLVKYLMNHDVQFYQWEQTQLGKIYRFVTSCFTKESEVINLDSLLNVFFLQSLEDSKVFMT